MPLSALPRRNWQRSFLAAVLAVFCHSARAQTVVDGFYLNQISFTAPSTGNVPCSEYGRAGFALRATPGVVQYLQVTASVPTSPTAAWIVQNVPLMPSFNTEQSGVNLTLLGVNRGACVTGIKLSYTITVTNTVITTAPAYSGGSTVFIGQVTDNDDGLDLTGATL